MRDSKNEYLDRIRRLVAEEMRIDPEKIKPDSRLGRDLGIDGDDASELIERFAEVFEVDMTNFEFHMYFGSESWAYSIYLLFKRNKTGEITISHLEEVAKNKKWIDVV